MTSRYLDHRSVLAGFQREPSLHITPVQFGSDNRRDYGVEEYICNSCFTRRPDPADSEKGYMNQSNCGVVPQHNYQQQSNVTQVSAMADDLPPILRSTLLKPFPRHGEKYTGDTRKTVFSATARLAHATDEPRWRKAKIQTLPEQKQPCLDQFPNFAAFPLPSCADRPRGKTAPRGAASGMQAPLPRDFRYMDCQQDPTSFLLMSSLVRLLRPHDTYGKTAEPELRDTPQKRRFEQLRFCVSSRPSVQFAGNRSSRSGLVPICRLLVSWRFPVADATKLNALLL